MADQKRWFKVWGSIAGDPHFAEVSLEDIGRWVLLGAYVAVHGTNGTVTVPGNGAGLCALLRVPDLASCKLVLERLPNVSVSENRASRRYGEFSVTIKNWYTYQMDSTARERMKTLRSKKRGEENKNPPPLAPPPEHELWVRGESNGNGRNGGHPAPLGDLMRAQLERIGRRIFESEA